MFIEIFITNIAILNYHGGYFLLLELKKINKSVCFQAKIHGKKFYANFKC